MFFEELALTFNELNPTLNLQTCFTTKPLFYLFSLIFYYIWKFYISFIVSIAIIQLIIIRWFYKNKSSFTWYFPTVVNSQHPAFLLDYFKTFIEQRCFNIIYAYYLKPSRKLLFILAIQFIIWVIIIIITGVPRIAYNILWYSIKIRRMPTALELMELVFPISYSYDDTRKIFSLKQHVYLNGRTGVNTVKQVIHKGEITDLATIIGTKHNFSNKTIKDFSTDINKIYHKTVEKKISTKIPFNSAPFYSHPQQNKHWHAPILSKDENTTIYFTAASKAKNANYYNLNVLQHDFFWLKKQTAALEIKDSMMVKVDTETRHNIQSLINTAALNGYNKEIASDFLINHVDIELGMIKEIQNIVFKRELDKTDEALLIQSMSDYIKNHTV